MPRTSWRSVLRLSTRFALPLLVCCSGPRNSFRHYPIRTWHCSQSGDAFLAAGFLASEIDALPVAVRRAVAAPGSGLNSTDVATCLSLTTSVLYHTQLLERGAPTDVLGAASGMVSVGDDVPLDMADTIQAGFFDNGCPFIGAYGVWWSELLPAFSGPICSGAQGGVVKRGLHSAIVSATTTAESICSARSIVVEGGLYSIPTVLRSQAVVKLLDVRRTMRRRVQLASPHSIKLKR